MNQTNTLRPHARAVLGARVMAVLVAAVLSTAAMAYAAPSAEQKCQSGRYGAASKYTACHQKAVAKYALDDDAGKLAAALSKCRSNYARAGLLLRTRATGTGSSCDVEIYVDNGDGTVTDTLTGLQWEKKTDAGGIHDKDNVYTWSAAGGAGDGTAYTSFLATLNSGGCFAGTCDWRLPTFLELSGIVAEPCDTGGGIPCVSDAFGEVVGGNYWSASETPLGFLPDQAWMVNFSFGDAFPSGKTGAAYVRAVRGGL